MGPLNLTRRLGGSLRSGGLVLALVLCTLLAETIDVVGLTERGRFATTFPAAGELVAAAAGLAVAAILGSAVDRRYGVAGRGSRLGRVAAVAAALGGALLVHELTAVGLHAEHSHGIGHLATHVAESVLPISLVLGAVLALVVGVRVGRRVAAVAWTSILVPARASTPATRILPGRRVGLPPGLPPAPRLPGRAPPVPAG